MNALISRQAALEVIDAVMPVDPNKSEYASGIACGAALAMTYVKQLPSSQPERKTGRWIELTNTNHTYVCSVCGRMLVNITDGKNMVMKNYPFCHCGADMRGEQDG